ncbi:hypothetical protein GCM10017653_10570 [Ancylobacter defluvii]|uniref:Uncharacterized protein n=1 Tax=Ancylobacter defluvii TaxID=1282440 RepID=A0A9W6JX30_9HYPH|nr:hypothetical protein GCM10017653_10570 [Ancylobacter defluvii]
MEAGPICEVAGRIVVPSDATSRAAAAILSVIEAVVFGLTRWRRTFRNTGERGAGRADHLMPAPPPPATRAAFTSPPAKTIALAGITATERAGDA